MGDLGTGPEKAWSQGKSSTGKNDLYSVLPSAGHMLLLDKLLTMNSGMAGPGSLIFMSHGPSHSLSSPFSSGVEIAGTRYMLEELMHDPGDVLINSLSCILSFVFDQNTFHVFDQNTVPFPFLL